MRRMGGLLVVVLMLSVLPASASADRGAAGDPAGRALDASGRLAVTAGPDGVRVARPVSGGLGVRHDPSLVGDPVALQQALAGLTREGQRLPGGTLSVAAPVQAFRDAMGLSEQGTAADAAPSGSHSYRVAYALGDVDGDGRADLADLTVTYHQGWDVPPTVSTRVRRGVDGTVLWSLPDSGNTVLVPVGDLDGDGQDDVVAVALVVTDVHQWSECDDDGCEDSYEAAFTQILTAHGGPTGATLWEDHHEGHVRWQSGYRFTDAGVQDWFTYDYDMVVAVPGGVGADGTSRVLRERLVGSEHYSLDHDDPTGLGLPLLTDRHVSYQFDGATTARVLQGATGEVLAELAHDGYAFLTAPGQLLGDGTDDLLWEATTIGAVDESCRRLLGVTLECSGTDAADTATVAAVDGRTFDVAWVTGGDDRLLFFAGAVGDLDGDGHLELMSFDRRPDGYGTTMIDGSNGTVRWERTDGDDWRFPMGVGDLDGDGHQDLVTVGLEFDFDTWDLTWIIDRLDGQTGQSLLTTRRDVTAPDSWCFGVSLYAFGLDADRDGDGVDEVSGGSVVTDYGEDCEGPGRSTSDVWVESAATGETLEAHDWDGVHFRTPVGDLTGEGSGDLLETHIADTGETTVKGLVGHSGVMLWERTLDGSAWVGGLGADVDGDGGDDLLVYVPVEAPGGGWAEQINIRRGVDAALLWAD